MFGWFRSCGFSYRHGYPFLRVPSLRRARFVVAFKQESGDGPSEDEEANKNPLQGGS
jgi:hypothetical protein